MRRGWFSLVAVLCLLASSTAYGQFFEGVQDFVSDLDYYVGFDVGGTFGSADVDFRDDLGINSFSESESDTVVYGSGKVGAETGKWRADVEFAYRDEMDFEISDFHVKSDVRTLLVSAYYDLINV